MKTPVEVQWVLKLGSTMFSMRTALLALLKSMATVDNTIYLEMSETKEVVQDPADLPIAKEFTEAFKVTQKEKKQPNTNYNLFYIIVKS
eukprot:13467263-Ditylum_brightwellii.AAC.1